MLPVPSQPFFFLLTHELRDEQYKKKWLRNTLASECHQFVIRGPFLESPGNLTGPESYFWIKVSRKVGCVLSSNEVHFVSLANNSTV